MDGDTQNIEVHSRRRMIAVEKLTRGKESKYWKAWWDTHSRDPVRLIAACTAVLLSLGPPPWLESMRSHPPNRIKYPPRIKGKNRHIQIRRLQREQWGYNAAVNNLVQKMGAAGHNSYFGPAQFRKFYAAWLLSLGEDDGDGE